VGGVSAAHVGVIADVSQPTTDEPVVLMFAPYLPLRAPLVVDGWQLVPVGELEPMARRLHRAMRKYVEP
jgi:hypothetical protein